MSNLRPIQVSADVVDRLFHCLKTRYRALRDRAFAHLCSFVEDGTRYRLSADQRAAINRRLDEVHEMETEDGDGGDGVDTGYPKFVYRVPHSEDVVPAFPVNARVVTADEGAPIDYRNVIGAYLRASDGDAGARQKLERMAHARGGEDEREFAYEVGAARQRLADVIAYSFTTALPLDSDNDDDDDDDANDQEEDHGDEKPSAGCVERALVLYGLSQSFNATERLGEFANMSNGPCFGFLGVQQRKRLAALATHFLLRDATIDSPHVCDEGARVFAAGVDGVVERDVLVAVLLLSEGVEMRDDNCVIDLEKLCDDLGRGADESEKSEHKEENDRDSERCVRLTLLQMSEQVVARNVNGYWEEGARAARAIREKLSMLCDSQST